MAQKDVSVSKAKQTLERSSRSEDSPNKNTEATRTDNTREAGPEAPMPDGIPQHKITPGS